MSDRTKSKPIVVHTDETESTYKSRMRHLQEYAKDQIKQLSDGRTTRRDDPMARRDHRSKRRDGPMTRSDDPMARRDDPMARRDDPTTRRDYRSTRSDDPMLLLSLAFTISNFVSAGS